MNERRRLLCNLYVCVYAHRYVVSCLLFVFSSFEFTRLFRIASRHAALFPLWLTLARLHAQWSGWLAGWLAYLFLTGRGSLGLFRIGSSLLLPHLLGSSLLVALHLVAALGVLILLRGLRLQVLLARLLTLVAAGHCFLGRSGGEEGP